MKKINIVKKNKEFSRILKTLRPYKTENFKIYIDLTQDEMYHFGFSVSKKIGNAVFRNKTRRQLKNILDQKKYKKSFNCIIMVKESIKEKSFQEIEVELLQALEFLKLYEGEHNEK